MEKNNFLIPKHKVLSETDKKALLEKYSLEDDHKLPKIKIKDNALSSLEGVKAGDVIEITRSSFAGDDNKYYRKVIE